MIWLKLLAAAMIGSGCFGLGCLFSSQYGKRLEAIRELKWFLVVLRGEIEYGRASLFDACKRAAADAGTVLRSAVTEIGKAEDSGISFADVFREKMQIALRNTALKEEDILEFFMWLGDTVFADEQMQMISLNRSIDRLEASISKLEREYAQYRKMAMGLGTLGGCLLLVILW